MWWSEWASMVCTEKGSGVTDHEKPGVLLEERSNQKRDLKFHLSQQALKNLSHFKLCRASGLGWQICGANIPCFPIIQFMADIANQSQHPFLVSKPQPQNPSQRYTGSNPYPSVGVRT